MYIEVNGKLRKSEDIELVDKLLELRKKNEPWAVIDELIKAWVKKTPEEAEAVKIDLGDQREILNDKEFGTTSGGADFSRRLVVLFPTTLQGWIRKMYSTDELPFDKKFFKELARRYPGFRVAQKV
jgi:hypothetical protein